MSVSDYTCGNCENVYQIDTDGPVIQPCPNCGSQEMVKAQKRNGIKEK